LDRARLGMWVGARAVVRRLVLMGEWKVEGMVEGMAMAMDGGFGVAGARIAWRARALTPPPPRPGPARAGIWDTIRAALTIYSRLTWSQLSQEWF
jgi:hypothetical protein